MSADYKPITEATPREVQFTNFVDVYNYVSQFTEIENLPRETLEKIHQAVTYALYVLMGTVGARVYISETYPTEQLVYLITSGMNLIKFKISGEI